MVGTCPGHVPGFVLRAVVWPVGTTERWLCERDSHAGRGWTTATESWCWWLDLNRDVPIPAPVGRIQVHAAGPGQTTQILFAKSSLRLSIAASPKASPYLLISSAFRSSFEDWLRACCFCGQGLLDKAELSAPAVSVRLPRRRVPRVFGSPPLRPHLQAAANEVSSPAA